MHYVYILFSKSLNRYYVGSTSNLVERIKKHNSVHKGFTGGATDWVLKWAEVSLEKEVARMRELQLKSWKSRTMLEKLIG